MTHAWGRLVGLGLVCMLLSGCRVSSDRTFGVPNCETPAGNPCWLKTALADPNSCSSGRGVRYKEDLPDAEPFKRSDIAVDRISTPVESIREPLKNSIPPAVAQVSAPEKEEGAFPWFGPWRGRGGGWGGVSTSNAEVQVIVGKEEKKEEEEKSHLEIKDPALVDLKTPLSRVEKLYARGEGGETRELRQYGYEVFRRTFDVPVEEELLINRATDIERNVIRQLSNQRYRGAVNRHYIMGPGDEILIRTTGGIEINTALVIDREGKIFIPQVGTVQLGNVPLSELHERIDAAFAREFKHYLLETSLGSLHAVRIGVMGHVISPGIYYLPSNITLHEALNESGGISKEGSLRKVHLHRLGEEPREIDLYDALFGKGSDLETALIDGDEITVSPIGPTVAIDGPVAGAIFELREAISLDQVLMYIGGTNAFVDLNEIEIERSVCGGYRELFRITTAEEIASWTVCDGDRVHLKAVVDFPQNSVSIEGRVVRTGVYTYREGMRISDLLTFSKGLLIDATLDYALLQRRLPSCLANDNDGLRKGIARDQLIWVSLNNILDGSVDDDLLLQRLDKLYVFSH
ncbi:MAG: SLBB domain-containing protein [Chlamydiia bacterium]|nr:SLBB domain-containing protein [Chlamydiia bacterium]